MMRIASKPGTTSPAVLADGWVLVPLSREFGGLEMLKAWRMILALLALFAAMQAWAAVGHATAESVWSEANALARAVAQVPEGAVVTGHRCSTFQVGGKDRFRCTVFWGT